MRRRLPRTALLLAAACALLLAAPRAHAQAEADDEMAAREEPVRRVAAKVSVVATRLGEEYGASTVRVITHEEIRRLPVRSLPELLRVLPGLDVRRRGVEGVQADIGIRGGDHNGTLILVDGEPVNDPQTNHLSADLDVPLDAVERVEVLYGAGAALYGSDAIGGVVNVVTRGAGLGRARGQVEGRYGHGSSSLDLGSVRLAGKAGDVVTLAVDGGRSESSGFLDDTELSTKTLRLTSRIDTGHGPVTLALGYADRDYGAYAFYGTRFPNQREATRTRTARLSSELAMGGWTISPSFSLRAHDDDFVLERTNPAFYENHSATDRSAFRLAARRDVFGGGLVLGAEAGREAVASSNIGDHRRDRGALFLEYGRPFDAARPERGGIRLGLRGDTYEGYGSRLSPHAAVSWAPSPSVRLRASVGTAFRVPSFTELYYSDPQNLGNPDLEPETATNLEAGGSVDLGPLTLDGVFFHRRGRNLIDYVRSSVSDPFRAKNVRQADASGIEAVLELRPDRIPSRVLTRLALQATYVFTDLKKLSAQADGATEGKYVLDPLHVKWDLIAGTSFPPGIAASARLSYLSRPSFADGVWLLEARLSYPLLEGEILDVYAEGENLGNVTYQEQAGVPLPGRTLLLGIHLTW